MEGFGDRCHKPSAYAARMEIEAVPEPSQDERAALLEALRAVDGSMPAAYASEWRRAALRDAADADEP